MFQEPAFAPQARKLYAERQGDVYWHFFVVYRVNRLWQAARLVSDARVQLALKLQDSIRIF